MRLGTCIMVMPGVSNITVNMRFRLHLAVMISLVMFPVLETSMPALPEKTSLMLGYLFIEFIMGILMGISARLFVATLQIAGEMIAFMAGMQASTLFNPGVGGQTSAPSLFLTITGITFIFVINLHHVIFQGVLESYHMFPAGTTLPLMGDSARGLIQVLSDIFHIGVKMAAPIMVMGFLTYVAFGVFNRLIPQLQVFFVSLPLNITIGIFMMIITLSGMFGLFAKEVYEHAFLLTIEINE